MIRRFRSFDCVAALFVVGHKEATSQERTPTAPRSKLQRSGASLNPELSSCTSDRLGREDGAGWRSEEAAPENPLAELSLDGRRLDRRERGHAAIETSVKWSKNNAFLIRSFRVSNWCAEPTFGDANHRLGPR